MEKKTRNSNVEILRIIAMLAIIIHHYVCHGLMDKQCYSGNRYILNILLIGGSLGVDIFFIISGYYMYKSKITASKILKIEGQVLFYSMAILIIMDIIYKNPPEAKVYLAHLFPTINNIYWFAASYIIIMLFSKYINKLVEALDKKEFKLLLFMLLINFTLPTYLGINIPVVFIEKTVALYLIGAYIRKYNINKSEERAKYRKKLLLYFALNTAVIIISTYLYHKTNRYVLGSNTFFVQQENPLIVLIAIYMFLLAISVPALKSKIINTIASTTFGIYLIHEHPIMRIIIWNKVINFEQNYNELYAAIYCIGISIVIFIICFIIDLIRIYTVEKIYMKIVKIVIEKIKNIKNRKILKIELT